MTDKTPTDAAPDARRLESWKEIAAYLRRDIRTVQRWEQREHLPIHRHLHAERVTVYAIASELDLWWRGRTPDGDNGGAGSPADRPVDPPACLPTEQGGGHAASCREDAATASGPPTAPVPPPVARRRHPIWVVAALAAAGVLLIAAAWTVVGPGGAPPARSPSPGPGAKASGVALSRLFASLTADGARPPARVDFGQPACAVVLTPDEREAFVSVPAAGTVIVVDTATGTVTHELPVGGQPCAMAAAPDGSAVFVGRLAGSLAVIHTRSKRVTEVAAGSPISDLAVTPDSRHVYLAAQYSGLIRYSPATGAVDAISTIGCPTYLAIDPVASRLYVSYQCQGPTGRPGHDTVDVFDLAGGARVVRMSGPPQVGGAIAVTPDGAFAWVDGRDACAAPSYDHTGCPQVPGAVINVFQASNGTPVRTLAAPARPEFGEIAFLPGGLFAIVGGDMPRVFSARNFAIVEAFDRPLAGVPQVTADGGRAWMIVDGDLTVVESLPDSRDVPPIGLVHHWRGDGSADDARNGMHGTRMGDTSFAPGVVGLAFRFAGRGSGVDLGARTAVDWTGADATLAAWVRLDAAADAAPIVDRLSVSPGGGWRLATDAGQRFEFCVAGPTGRGCIDDGPARFRSTTVARPGIWYHLAVVRRSDRFELAVNGRVEATGEFPPLANPDLPGSLRIGADGLGGALRGLIDEVVVYNRALEAAEISRLARRPW